MAIYHLTVKTHSRSKGQSATAAAAYRSGEQITDERTGEVHDYTRKEGVESSHLITPDDSPEWANNRAQLWNEAEKSETRKNSTVAREFEVALPAELNPAEREKLACDFGREISERHGVAVDVSIHAPGREGDNRNHHAHILCTTRRLGPEGFGEKSRELDDKKTGEVDHWRERWATLANERLEQAGHADRIDHRSLEAQGIDRAPGEHLGPTATAIERKGNRSRRGDDARQRQTEHQEQRHQGARLQDQIQEADQEAGQIRDQLNQEQRHERTESARRTARAHGIEPVNDQTGSKPGERRDLERRAGPRVEALGPDTGTQRGRRGDPAGAGDALPNVQRGGNRGDGQRARADLLPGADARHGRGEGHKMQSPQDTGSGAGLGQALGQGAKQASGKLKAPQPAKGKAKQGQQAQEIENSFNKFTQKFGQFAGQILGALKERGEQPQQPAKPASQKAQPAQPTRPAPTPRPQQAAPESPTPGATAAKPEARPEPKPEAKKPSADFAAKVLEIDAKLNRDQGATGLQRLAKGAYRESDPQRGAMLNRQLSERSADLGRRATAGDPAALGDFKAAAGRLAKTDPLSLAHAEKGFDSRAKLPGVELSADRLNKAAAGDLSGLDKSLAGKLPAGQSIADQAKQIGDTLPTKKGPQNIMKGPKG